MPAILRGTVRSCSEELARDEEAITQMVEDNTNQCEGILPSERVKALKMQLSLCTYTIEELVQQDHIVRKLEALLDLSLSLALNLPPAIWYLFLVYFYTC